VASVAGHLSKKLLVVDHDAEVCAALRGVLGEAGFVVDVEPDGERGAIRAESGRYGLLILDVMLEGLDGFEVLRRIRRTSQVPILMLSAKADRIDRVLGLEAGADDYLAKPFFPDELLARIRAILRRCSPGGSQGGFQGALRDLPEKLRMGDLCLVPADRDAYFRDRPLGLTAMECEILEVLIRSCGRVVSRDTLSIHLHDRLTSPFDRSVDTHVSRLRRKLGAGRNMILSVRGVGYQLRYPGNSAEALE
jgi:two-component system OmpR family response regulator